VSKEAIFFISSEFKGNETIEAAKAEGCHVYFMTEERHKDKPWVWDSIDEAFFTPNFKKYQDVINTVTWLLRSRKVDRIIPLDEFEQELAAVLREHVQLPGKSVSEVKPIRDKLAMRNTARAAGIPVPNYIGVLNYDQLRTFMERVPPMWLLKPRTEASAMGIRKAQNSEDVWRGLDELGDGQSYYLLEQFVPGEVFHVDSVIWDGKVVFTSVQQYGKPPLQTYQGGGIFTSRTLPDSDPDSKALRKLNQQVIDAVGHHYGVAHAEFIKSKADGSYYFLEIAARVGGAFIGDLIETATGINLWREWSRTEIAMMRGEKYKLPLTPRKDSAGLIVTLAKQEYPDLSAYNDPEVAWTAKKPYHAAMVLKSSSPDRIQTLLDSYTQRFAEDFLAVVDPMGPQRTGLVNDED
jgi:biotin carboxylase